MRRRDVEKRQIYIETTLCISTLKFTTSSKRRINVVYFNVDMNNVRQRRNNVVKMTASKKNKKTPGKIQIGKIQIEFLEFKILATIS